MAEHRYELTIAWTGDRGTGTSTYTSYERQHTVSAEGRPQIPGSSDPGFRGDQERWNPEQLLVASLSQCHMLWYLHLCSRAGVVVREYVDRPLGTLVTGADGSGRFTDVLLSPQVTVGSAEQIDRSRPRGQTEGHATRFRDPRCDVALHALRPRTARITAINRFTTISTVCAT
ncbi:MAG: OsmC family protein [Actinomycetota bacterium]|nr:OsmC family protein [Actinomycetota bacterium]